MLAQVPCCTNFQELPWKSIVDVPWQFVPGPAAQSFSPLSATPKHFSLPAATAALASASVSGAAAAKEASAEATALARITVLTLDFIDIGISPSLIGKCVVHRAPSIGCTMMTSLRPRSVNSDKRCRYILLHMVNRDIESEVCGRWSVYNSRSAPRTSRIPMGVCCGPIQRGSVPSSNERRNRKTPSAILEHTQVLHRTLAFKRVNFACRAMNPSSCQRWTRRRKFTRGHAAQRISPANLSYRTRVSP